MHPHDRISLLMTEEVLSVAMDEPAGEVLRLFAGYPVHHLPVLRDGEVVGMLSSADVMKLEHFLPRTGTDAQSYLNQRLTVAALMRREAVTVQADQTVQDAAELMARHGIHALPVVDSRRRLLGIVTTSDLIAAALRDVPASAAAAAPEPQPGGSANLQQWTAELEQVLHAADRYLSAGQSPQLHSELLHAIVRAKRTAEQRAQRAVTR